MEREELYFRLLTLVPDAKFSFRLLDDEGKALSLCVNPIQLDKWAIDWSSENQVSCPTLKELNSIDNLDIPDFKEKARKIERNKDLADNLTMVAQYSQAKISNPALPFVDYLDGLEAIQKQVNQ